MVRLDIWVISYMARENCEMTWQLLLAQHGQDRLKTKDDTYLKKRALSNGGCNSLGEVRKMVLDNYTQQIVIIIHLDGIKF